MNYDHICYGCFRDKGSAQELCPFCGYTTGEGSQINTLPPGTILNGRYLIGKVLGVGGFGATYLAFDMKLEEKCACKEYLPSGLAGRSQDRYTVSVIRTGGEKAYLSGLEKFLNEARILARLKQVPNIVSVRDYFKENGTAYFVMNYVDGQSLKSYLKSRGGRIGFAEAARILTPVMRSLAQVHAMNLLHRDISPDNISLTKKGEPVLLDFGAARSSAGGGESVSVILKHGYAPAEQYSTHGNQGPWTDIYAMGATFYHCITGVIPQDAVERMQGDRMIAPERMGAALPPACSAAIMKALAVRAEDRYANMTAFAEDLERGMSGAQGARVPEGAAQRPGVPYGAVSYGAGRGQSAPVTGQTPAAGTGGAPLRPQPDGVRAVPTGGTKQPSFFAKVLHTPKYLAAAIVILCGIAAAVIIPLSLRSAQKTAQSLIDGAVSAASAQEEGDTSLPDAPQSAAPPQSAAASPESSAVPEPQGGESAESSAWDFQMPITTDQEGQGISSGSGSAESGPDGTESPQGAGTAAQYATFEDAEAGLSFEYDAAVSEPELSAEAEFDSGFRTVMLRSDHAEIDVVRLGQTLGSAEDTLRVFEDAFSQQGYSLSGSESETLELTNLTYFYARMEKEGADLYLYSTSFEDEVIFLVLSGDGQVTDAEFEQFANIGVSVSLS